MALYLTKLVNGQVQKLRVSPTKAMYRGYWAVIVGGFAGTSVTCNGVTKFIGSSERVAFNIITPGTYTFTATRQGTTITKEVVLNDDTQEYIINLSMFIGMQQLEYIESTGTQYIDTGVIYSDVLNARLELDAIMLESASVCGIGRSGSYFGGPFVGLQSNGFFGYSAGIDDQTTGVAGSSNERYKYDLNIPASTYVVKDASNNVLVNVTNITKSTRSETPSCILFGYYGNPNTGDGPYKLRSMKIYSCKIYDNGVLVRDFIPIKDDTGHGALYDKVTQQIFYNSGTGDFICGPNKPYTRIQYLESTGTQYIDTGILPNSTTTSDISVMFNTIIADSSIPLGSRSTGSSSDSPDQFYISASTGSGIICRSGTNITTLIQNPSVNTRYNLSVSNSYATADGTYTLTLFGFNNKGTIGNKLAQKIYSCKIYNNGTLVRDYVPVLDYDGVPCMLDQVEGRLYYNQGTGEFVAGPELVGLEYIESTGTQYIDTGVVGNLNTEYEITVKNNSSISSGVYAIFGSRASASENVITTVCANVLHSIINDFGDTTTTRQMPTRTSAEIMHKYTIKNSKSERTITDNNTGWTDTVTTTYSGSLTTPTNLYIGYAGSIRGISGIENLQGNIYSCKIWNNETLVRDFIPMKIRTEVGMYDTVSGQFFTNAGEGEFVAGPEKQ